MRRFRRGALLPLALLATWWWFSASGGAASRLFVPPGRVLETGWHMLLSGELLTALGASICRDVAGLVVGAAAGVVAGVLLALSATVRHLFAPTLDAVRQVSLFAWIPLLIVWFGLGELGKIVFISLSAFFPVALNTMQGVAHVPKQYTELARVFRFSAGQLFFRIVLPSALPSVFTGIYVALVSSWIATLGAEYLMTSGAGIGNLLTDGRENFLMDQVLLGVAIVGGVGALLHYVASRLELKVQRSSGKDA
ncbi:ABC transporter permease [Paraburkholderia sp. JPY465]|uniref:ABC transporter permease n=1 Tax=Paraburkholderia sp. JPY465 TaxID=3042285 RepID=UPI003D2008AF